MKKNFIILTLMIGLLACNENQKSNNPTNKTKANIRTDSIDKSEVYKEPATNCFYNKATDSRQNTFPFNKASKIEIVSFDCLFKTSNGKLEQNQFDKITKDNKVISERIKEQIEINQLQTDSLFAVLYDYGGLNSTQADCYNPRHCIIFYEQGKIIAYLELCLECSGYRATKGISFGSFCDEKWCKLWQYFKSIGMKEGFDISDKMCAYQETLRKK
jgi:hypothetical protein